ncbi:DUF6577 family protein [Duncaniella freteri]|uniref:Uncharacterized protein n=1 Tax=Duncaniella freteri TaxID=2530391 RepID=A0A4Z0V4X2_9BACT|nr:DUF6577 family protein [Duncaniella freteri]TGG39264.1 hypothetical protein EZ315_00485 [Duncaniella freteri]
MIETRAAILTYAENRESFRFADLFSYLNGIINISKVTLSWYLREMVKDDILFKLGRGIYTSRQHQSTCYTPQLREKALKLGKRIGGTFPFIKVSVFDGQVLADFQHHLSSNNLIYIEVEREAMESVFHWLKSERYIAYLNPNKEFVYDNIDISKEAVIVKPLISESPLTEIRGISTPRIEKILVDILCDDDMDYLHGSEWHYILDHVMNTYSVNRSTLMRYASRRNAKDKVGKALENLNTHD